MEVGATQAGAAVAPGGGTWAKAPAARTSGASAATSTLSWAPPDNVLDGSDWRMRLFPFCEGEKQRAFAPEFYDRDARRVTVPQDTQLQAGFTGIERFIETKELIFGLLPGETRDVAARWRTHAGSDSGQGTLTATGANVVRAQLRFASGQRTP